MREIKFRAWQDDRQMIHQRGVGVQFILEFYKKLYYDLDVKYLMQYTGLKDKNGKEIYEGDIVMPLDYKEVDGNWYAEDDAQPEVVK